jgi:hypothetical protein
VGQPFVAIWMTPNSTMAGATSMNTSSTPNRIMPPAMPKMPEMKEDPSTAAATAAMATAPSVI